MAYDKFVFDLFFSFSKKVFVRFCLFISALLYLTQLQCMLYFSSSFFLVVLLFSHRVRVLSCLFIIENRDKHICQRSETLKFSKSMFLEFFRTRTKVDRFEGSFILRKELNK